MILIKVLEGLFQASATGGAHGIRSNAQSHGYGIVGRRFSLAKQGLKQFLAARIQFGHRFTHRLLAFVLICFRLFGLSLHGKDVIAAGGGSSGAGGQSPGFPLGGHHQPAGDGGSISEVGELPEENREDRLGQIFTVLLIQSAVSSDRPDQWTIPFDQFLPARGIALECGINEVLRFLHD